MKGEGPPELHWGCGRAEPTAPGHAGLLARRSDGCLLRKPRGLPTGADLASRGGRASEAEGVACPEVRTREEAR